jgi:predicted site-specific integrase-resolvase
MMVVDDGEAADDSVGETIEVLMKMCASMFGRRGERNQVLRAVPAGKRHSAPVTAAG